jgi:hypothetical protein
MDLPREIISSMATSPVDYLMQPGGLFDRGLRVVGYVGLDLQGDKSVPAPGLLVDGREDVASVPYVLRGDLPEHLLGVVFSLSQFVQLLVVEIRACYGLLEDGRVRCNANDAVFYHPLEAAVLYVLARELVDPWRLSQLPHLLQSLVHLSPPYRARYWDGSASRSFSLPHSGMRKTRVISSCAGQQSAAALDNDLGPPRIGLDSPSGRML